MLEFQIVPQRDLSGGEDAKSVPSSILAGYCESLLNVDTNSGGYLGTRKGYEGYFGWVPFRVSTVEHIGASIRFTLGTAATVDLSEVGSTPIVVYGRLNGNLAPSGDYNIGEDNCVYYSGFLLSSRQALVPMGTVTVDGDVHGAETSNIVVRLAEVAETTGTSHTLGAANSTDIDTTSFDISIQYTVAGNTEGFVYYLERTATSGSVHIAAVSAQTAVSITAATHGLDNFNIQVECLDTVVSTGNARRVEPSYVRITSAGTVEVGFGSDFTGNIILSAVTNVRSFTSVAGANLIGIQNLSSPWIIASVYVFNTSTGKLEQAAPSSLAYDASDNSAVVGVTTASPSSVEIYYSFGSTVTNQITVTDASATSENYVDVVPQLTIWGIPHAGSYKSGAGRNAHVTHLDTYRREGELRPVCGLGGNLYAARTREEVGSTYNIPSLQTNLRMRVDGTQNLAPLFHHTDSTDTRTRGKIVDASIGDNRARVVAATYINANIVNFTLSFTNKTGTIATSIGTADYLTISGLDHAPYCGAFPVLDTISESATAAVIQCRVSGAFTADFDSVGADGRAGVFTDRILPTASPDTVVGDRLYCSALDEDKKYLVAARENYHIYMDNVTEQITLPGGTLVYGSRSTDMVPLRDSTLTRTVEDLVRGDMLEVSGIDRKVRVKSINNSTDFNISEIAGDGAIATAVLAAAHSFIPGQRLLLVNTGFVEYEQGVTVLAVPSTTSFTFLSTSNGSASSGRVVGKTVELDEVLTIRDGSGEETNLTVSGRWIPIEAPYATQQQAPFGKDTFLDTAPLNQIRSTIISDTMFFTNGEDEVYKFDGDSVYQAGLISWQPQLFAAIDTGTGSIVIDTTTVAWTAKAANKYTVALGAGLGFTTGDRIKDSQNSAVYSVLSVTDDGTNDFIYVDQAITGTGSGNLSRVARYRYYFRLNAIDVNNNVVASAATGANDFLVELSASAQINLRLVGMPVLGAYDYDRLELQVYRTKANTAAPYYLVRTLPQTYESAKNHYMDVVDGTPDELLRDFDVVNTALKGAEIGAAWSAPLRAKTITSTGNRLVLGNIQD